MEGNEKSNGWETAEKFSGICKSVQRFWILARAKPNQQWQGNKNKERLIIYPQ